MYIYNNIQNQQQLKNQQNGLILTVNHCTMGVELKNANEETDSGIDMDNIEIIYDISIKHNIDLVTNNGGDAEMSNCK